VTVAPMPQGTQEVSPRRLTPLPTPPGPEPPKLNRSRMARTGAVGGGHTLGTPDFGLAWNDRRGPHASAREPRQDQKAMSTDVEGGGNFHSSSDFLPRPCPDRARKLRRKGVSPAKHVV